MMQHDVDWTFFLIRLAEATFGGSLFCVLCGIFRKPDKPSRHNTTDYGDGTS